MLKLQITNKKGTVISYAEGESSVWLVHAPHYHKGDVITLVCSEPGFYEIRLEDTLPPTLVYIRDKAVFPIPFGTMPRVGYPPRAFKSVQHLLTARKAESEQIYARRNLALNPFDTHGDTGMYPHASANVETRDEALFAARNAIDGVFANTSHYPYPFQSWGINKDPNAALTVEFGVPVDIDEIRLTLRGDYPHDSYWTKATIEFTDGSREVVSLTNSLAPQCFTVEKKGIKKLTLKELIKHEDESPYPALTQLEAWGYVAK